MTHKKLILNKFSYLLVFVLLFSYCNAQNTTDFNIERIDKYIENSRQDWEIPGMAVAIIKDKKVIFAKGYGVRSVDGKEKVDEQTLFAIASNTKAFTSAAMSILVAEGKVSWDDKVTDYLPYFQLKDEYASKEMTIRDLLCHRSGLKTFSGDLLWYGTTYSRQEVVERAKFLEPAYSFRSKYGYSNIMYIAAGLIIEKVTGQTWDEFIKEKFIVPLEMNATNTSISEFGDNKNIAQPHHVIIDEEAFVIPYVNWDNVAPAGAINSNVEDMSKWLMMQLNNGTYNGNRILDKEQIWEMRSSQTVLNVPSYTPQIWESIHFKAYGLGWELFDYHGFKVIEHGGGADGMISKTVIVPERNFAFVILTNSINYLPEALMYYLLDELNGKYEKDWSKTYLDFFKRNEKSKKSKQETTEQERNKNTKPSLNINEYTGVFKSELYGNAEVKLVAGQLVLDLIPTPMFVGDLTHWENDSFQIILRNTPGLPPGIVTFVLNKKNEVVEMQIDIPNPDFDFTEMKFLK